MTERTLIDKQLMIVDQCDLNSFECRKPVNEGCSIGFKCCSLFL